MESKEESYTVAPGATSMPNPRQCSFIPAKHMIELDYDGIKELYLPVQYRVLWFQVYCHENGIRGIIDDSAVQYLPEVSHFKATAEVFMDDVLVSRSSAGKLYTPDNPEATRHAMNTACTSAKGRALSNLGFDLASCRLEDGETIPCDTGVKIERNPSNPMHITAMAENKGYAPANSESEKTMSIDDARAHILTIGENKGKTMGEVLALNRASIEFYASEKFANKKDPLIKIAAQVLLADAVYNLSDTVIA